MIQGNHIDQLFPTFWQLHLSFRKLALLHKSLDSALDFPLPTLGHSLPEAATISFSSLALQLLLSAPRPDLSPLRDWMRGFSTDLSHSACKSIRPAVLSFLPSCTSTPRGSETSWVRELQRPKLIWGGVGEELAFTLLVRGSIWAAARASLPAQGKWRESLPEPVPFRWGGTDGL